MANKPKALRGRVKRILKRSVDWETWRLAQQSVLDLERYGKGLQFQSCVDTSEVIEHQLPKSLWDKTYPNRLDLSLLLLFRDRDFIILPPHARELHGLRDTWRERVRQAQSKLQVLRGGLAQVQDQIDRLAACDDEDVYDQLVELILREKASIFGAWFGPSEDLDHILGKLHQRLHVLRARDLGFKRWEYAPNQREIDLWYHELSGSRVSLGGPPTHLTDAHALHMVELLNRDLPADELLVLYTHSFKILSVLERRRKDDPDLLRKSGISLVQPPEVALVQELLRPQGEDDAPALPVSELTIDLERSKSMSDLRKRLQDDCLPFLEREEMPKADVESLVRSLEGELAELADKTQDWQSLERVAIETSRDEDSGIFQQFRAAIEGFDRDNLRRVLKRNLSELIDEMEELQQRISVGFLPKPEASLTFEHIAPAPSFGMRAILHSKPGSTVYSFRFRSAKIRRYLDRIQDHLERLDQARGSDEQAERFGLQLQQEMYQCEVELKGDPEFYLLLASVYSSRERWFQAYDAASQGLKRLWPQGEVEDSRDPGRERAVTTCELLLAKASALRNWTLREYSDLGLVAAGLLEEAATICRLCLSQQQQWGDLVGVGPEAEAFRDPRCLREIGLIYGTAREDRIPVHPQSEDFQAAGCVAPQDHDDLLLALAICYSRRAYELAREDERMRIFYQNSLIYLLVEEDRDEDLDERLKLVSEFDSPAIETDPNFLDTLAWHHLALARRHKKQGEAFEEDFAEAWRFIDQARALVDRGHRYYHRLIDRHYKEIVAGP